MTNMPEIVTSLLLALESILVLACLLAAIRTRLTSRVSSDPVLTSGERLLAQLKELAESPMQERHTIVSQLQTIKHRASLHKDEDGLATMLHNLLDSPSSELSLEAAINRALSREEKGAVGMCTLLKQAGTLSGLAGMLGGVSYALTQYLTAACNPKVFIAGFAMSVMATLWGLGITLVALFTARALWLPHLARLRNDLITQAAAAEGFLATIRNHQRTQRRRKRRRFDRAHCGPTPEIVVREPTLSHQPSGNGATEPCPKPA